jgi:hypothetical protein
MAGTEKKKVWFEKCDCGGKPHGYLHIEGLGEYPVPIFSVQNGTIGLDSVTGDINLSEGEKEEVRGQMRDAGLAEEVTEADVSGLLAVAAAAIAATAVTGSGRLGIG